MEGARRRLRVLLVEDDRGDAYLVSELLAEVDAPVELTVAPTVAQAKAQLAGIDCVLLDLELPDASGMAALRSLRAARSHVAVVVLTGLSDEHVGVAALAQGAQDYLIKGRVDGVLLERAIRYAVERRRAEDGAMRLREAELREAESARLEKGLLPRPLVDTDAVRLRTFYRAGRALGLLGGDFYDAVQTGPQRVAALVGDVCGHAAEEAALGAQLRVSWRALTLAGVDDEQVLRSLERVLVSERRADEIFATLVTVSVDLDTGWARIRTAGHPPPLLVVDGSAEPLAVAPSVVLGLLPGRPNKPTDIALPAGGWAILVYTDGLIEARNDDEFLGTDGLCRMVEAYVRSGGTLAEMPEWLAAEAERRNGGALADDVAMLLMSGGGPDAISGGISGGGSGAAGGGTR